MSKKHMSNVEEEEVKEAPEEPVKEEPKVGTRDAVQPLAGAAVPTISASKFLENGMGAATAGATNAPGLAVAGTAKPGSYAPNGGIPVLCAVMPFSADGLSHYLPMPVGSVLLEAQVFVVTAGASTAVKLGNDGTAGAADLGTVNVSTVGAVNLPLLGAVVTGLTGSSLQVTVGTDATLQCVLAVQYVVMR